MINFTERPYNHVDNSRELDLIVENFLSDVSIGGLNNLEFDFVCKKQDKIFYIQVSYILDSDETIEREFRPLLEIKDNYPKYVISMDSFDFSDKGIIHMNMIDFLLENKKIRYENG